MPTTLPEQKQETRIACGITVREKKLVSNDLVVVTNFCTEPPVQMDKGPLLSDAPLSRRQIEIGQQIAVKHGLKK